MACDPGWGQARATVKRRRKQAGGTGGWKDRGAPKAGTSCRQRQASTPTARFFPHRPPDGRLCAFRATARLFVPTERRKARSRGGEQRSRSRFPPKSLPPSTARPKLLASPGNAGRSLPVGLKGKVAFSRRDPGLSPGSSESCPPRQRRPTVGPVWPEIGTGRPSGSPGRPFPVDTMFYA